MTKTLPYGSWPSPISAADVAAGTHPVDAARFVGDDVWWSERIPAEGGRTAVRRWARDGRLETLLPEPWDARSRVHEYGGGAWAVTDDEALVFVEKSDQRVWLMTASSQPRPLTPAGAGMRFGDLTVTAGRLVAVRETHGTGDGVPPRDIVSIPLDGSGADDPSRIGSLVAGSDFLAYPRISPDGSRLAWIAWDHPNMPWDGSQLRVGQLVDDAVHTYDVVAGGPGESVVQPEWVGDDLLFSSDRTGWWNLYRFSGGRVDPIAAAESETGGPLWNLGTRWFLPLDDGRILAVRTNGSDALVLIDPASGAVAPVTSDATSRVLLDDARGSRVLLHGAGARTSGGLWLVDLDGSDPRPHLLRSAVDTEPDAAWLPIARAVEADGPRGTVHAFAYPPTHPEVTGPDDERPPYLVLAHGGPTSNASGGASPDIAFWTSRGIGVLDVNYGGSTGYGRAYRERLNGQWGIVDRDDVVAAASGIAELGLADAARLAIRGGSAGGWTVLCALTGSDRFAAGISRYGVADLRALAAETHDFEARYLDSLLGPLPATEHVFVARSPLSHPERFTTPMLIEQGLDDEVVPPSQSEAVRDALVANRIPHAYLAFEGESHGFRRAETIIRSLEAELSFLGQTLGFEPPGVPLLTLEGPAEP